MEELQNFIEAIQTLALFDEDELTDEVLKAALDNLEKQFSSAVVTQSINQVVDNFEDQGLTKTEARDAADALMETIKEMVYDGSEYTGNKKILIDTVLNKTFAIFDEAVDKYHSYAIELPMTVDKAAGAKEPTYAHDTDAAADLYAPADQIVPAHSYGNMIKTGVKIQLPEGWLAMILPRSSMGTKTPLRLSNSVGLIDSGYRGELGILYDNTSNEDYQITAGDRIAQLLVMPSYRFKAKVVDILADSDRGEGGFGASGK